jgi:mgtE-like transporter
MIYSLKRILEESMPVLIISVAITIGAGVILSKNSNMILLLPGIIVIVPSFINMGGSLMAVLSSRLSSALHLGFIHPIIHRTKTLERNLLATFITAAVSFTLLGVFAGLFTQLMGIKGLDLVMFPVLTLVAGFMTVLILSLLSVVFSYLSFKRGVDPDNVVIPLLTSLGDFIGIVFLFLTLSIVI